MKIGRYIVGLISGLTFGMLFAPRKGKDLRKELMKKGKKSDPYSSCHEGAKVLGKAFKEAGEDAWGEIKSLGDHEQVAALLEMSKEKMHAFLEMAEEKGYDVAATVQEKLEGLVEMVKEKAEEGKEMAMDVEKVVEKKVIATKKNVAFAKRKVQMKARQAKSALKKAAKKAGVKPKRKAAPKKTTKRRTAKKSTRKK